MLGGAVCPRRKKLGRHSLAWPTTALLVAAFLEAACASRNSTSCPPVPPMRDASAQKTDDRADALAAELEVSRGELESALAEIIRLQGQVTAARQGTAAAEERLEALRHDVDRALDDVLASKASLRGLNNRALAISRIAEVRVQMQSAGRRGEPEVAARLRGAESLLARADRTLEQGNYGGAAYLADRAAEMVEHARTLAEVAARQAGTTAGLIPIVPARTVEVAVTANLRSGPGTERSRVGTAEKGTRLEAVGRVGEWLQVETEAGRMAWIHRATVR
jgi:Bacterial SH3 domain